MSCANACVSALALCDILGPASHAALLGGIIYGMNKQEGEMTLLAGSIAIILVQFIVAYYQSYMKTDCEVMQSDMAVVLRALCSALFTTDLFVKNEVIGEAWDYLPTVIVGTLSFIYLIQYASDCDRTFMQMYMIANMVAQLYVAAKIGNPYTGIAAFSLLLAYSLCMDGEGFLEVPPTVWYNFLACAFCLTSCGEPIELKKK